MDMNNSNGGNGGRISGLVVGHEEIAERLAISARTADKLLKQRVIPAIKLGAQWGPQSRRLWTSLRVVCQLARNNGGHLAHHTM
jgi:hypothetical protein